MMAGPSVAASEFQGDLTVEPAFDFDGVFGEDYLYFFADRVGPARSDADATLLWQLLELEPGMEVLDLACGHGRIASRLARRGCHVTGLDSSESFLKLAREEAAAEGIPVAYARGDMRALPWSGQFDRVVSMFTSFGYFTDLGNRQVLAEVARALRPGGRLALELTNRDWLASHFQPSAVRQREDDLLLDQNELELLTGRMITDRTVIRGRSVSHCRFFVRLFTYTELRDWLRDAGFTHVEAYGEDGGSLQAGSCCMIVIAGR